MRKGSKVKALINITWADLLPGATPNKLSNKVVIAKGDLGKVTDVHEHWDNDRMYCVKFAGPIHWWLTQAHVGKA